MDQRAGGVEWAPAPPTVVTATVDDASADPDPPLIACDRPSPGDVNNPGGSVASGVNPERTRIGEEVS